MFWRIAAARAALADRDFNRDRAAREDAAYHHHRRACSDLRGCSASRADPARCRRFAPRRRRSRSLRSRIAGSRIDPGRGRVGPRSRFEPSSSGARSPRPTSARSRGPGASLPPDARGGGGMRPAVAALQRSLSLHAMRACLPIGGAAASSRRSAGKPAEEAPVTFAARLAWVDRGAGSKAHADDGRGSARRGRGRVTPQSAFDRACLQFGTDRTGKYVAP
jgi:hypothetical protein